MGLTRFKCATALAGSVLLLLGCASTPKPNGVLYKEKGTGQIYVLFTGSEGVKIPFPRGDWSVQKRNSFQIRLIERKSDSALRIFEASALSRAVIAQVLGENVRDTVQEFLDFEVNHHLRSDLEFKVKEFTFDTVQAFASLENPEQRLGLLAWKSKGVVYLISGLYTGNRASPKDSLLEIHRSVRYLDKEEAALLDTLKGYNQR